MANRMRAFEVPRASGFAYLWVLLSMAFLGVSLVLVADVYTTSARRDREAELLSIGRQFREALRRYHEAQFGNLKQYPASLDDLLRDPRSPGVTRHLRQVFIDPMTGKAEWGLVRVNGRIVGIHSLSDETPIKQAGFDDDDVAFAQAGSYREWVFTYPPGLLSTRLADTRAEATEPRLPLAAAASAAAAGAKQESSR